MIYEINFDNSHLHGGLLQSSHRLRNKSFVENNRWKHPDIRIHRGAEFDQFDTPVAHYLVRPNMMNSAVAMARLSPTTHPYMLKSEFPSFVEPSELVSKESVYEGTRFCIDKDLPALERRKVMGELMAGIMEFGLEEGIDYILVFMPEAILDGIFVKAGCEVTAIGDSCIFDGRPCRPARVTVNLATLHAIYRNRRLEGPVLRRFNAQLTHVAA